MYRRIFLFLFFVNISLLNAQQNHSLRDSIYKYQYLNPNLAIEYGLEYLELRVGDDPDQELVGIYSKIGEILLYMELYTSALEYFNSALNIRNSIKEIRMEKTLYSKTNPPWVVLNIGNIYFKKDVLLLSTRGFPCVGVHENGMERHYASK